MLFNFLKYLQPTHYFRLNSSDGKSIFPIVESLPENIRNQLVLDENYQSKIAQSYDVSWQAIQKGYIGNVETYSGFEDVSIRDNYIFLRKNFHPAWIFYVLLYRLFSFFNPIKEIKYFLYTRRISRGQWNNDPISHKGWKNYKSKLIEQTPKVSVIIPTLNRYHFLKDVLTDLEEQDYSNFEVIIVDQSDAFNPKFYEKFKIDIKLIRQEEKALWLARNTAIKKSKGELLALSEDDVRINSNWISSHLKCLDFFKCEVSAGVFYPAGKQIPKERSYFAIASQFATGNAMLYKTVFEKVGLFDRQFEKQRMGDGEFGLRIYLKGIKSVSNPVASCVDVKAGIGGLREMGSWDSFRPSNFFAPRPIPSVLYYFRRYYGNTSARMALWKTIPISIFPYQFKKNKSLLILGAFVSLILVPLVLFQVLKSWNLSSKKIKQGPLIDTLK